jgi:hypothetical protein
MMTGAYRGSRIMAPNPRILAPNPRLPRPRSAPQRSPLSRKPLAATRRALITAFAIVALSARTAVACTCVTIAGEPVPPEIDLFRNADGVVIFTGTALRVKQVPSGSAEADLYRPNGSTTTFLVEGYWGGLPFPEMVAVTTPGLGGTCGFDFQEGQCYQVEAWPQSGGWKTTICSMTGLAWANRSVLDKLEVTDGPAKTPHPKNGS